MNKQIILNKIEDLVANFLYKNDKDLSIQEAIRKEIITIDEIVQHFKMYLIEGLKE